MCYNEVVAFFVKKNMVNKFHSQLISNEYSVYVFLIYTYIHTYSHTISAKTCRTWPFFQRPKRPATFRGMPGASHLRDHQETQDRAHHVVELSNGWRLAEKKSWQNNATY
jgi:hypothetical protein